MSGRTAGALAFAGVLAGCSGAGTSQSTAPQAAPATTRSSANGFNVRQAQPPRARGWISPSAKSAKASFYWGSYDNNTIDILSKNGKVLGQITNGVSDPERLFVDKKKNLYASEAGNNTVTEYAPGSSIPKLTISNGVSTPTGIVVGGDGTIYVANVDAENVTEYPAGSASPSLTIVLSDETPENLAVDKQNNLYIQYLGGTKGSGVLEVPPGKTSGTDLGLNISSAGALEVDKKGNILILDTETPALDIFPPKSTSPSKQIDITSGDPFELSLNKKESRLYVSVSSGLSFIVQSLNYPKGTSFSSKFTTSDGDWPIASNPDNAL
jgi:hypothetical protein